ncbi:MAG: hypothetical protein WDZ94_05780 [Patescibacteria group bacterium]
MSITDAPTPAIAIPKLVVLPEAVESRVATQLLLEDWLEQQIPQGTTQFQKQDLDCIHLPESGETLKIEMIRELKIAATYTMPASRFRHIFLHNLHQSSEAAQQALLKTLEEGTPQTQWWLTTQSQHAVLPTIQSRCQLQRLTPKLLQKLVITDMSDLPHYDKIHSLLDTVHKLSYGQLTDEAQTFTNKDAAAQALTIGIFILHQKKNAAPEVEAHLAALKHSLAAQNYLAANVSPRLVIENWLFSLKKISSTKSQARSDTH